MSDEAGDILLVALLIGWLICACVIVVTLITMLLQQVVGMGWGVIGVL